MDIATSNTAAGLELTEAMFLILVALADEDRHGYAIMQEVEEETAARVRLGPGTLYRSIKRLLGAGLIAESEHRPGPGEDERRRYYRITEPGRNAAVVETERLEKLLGLARRRSLIPVAADGKEGA